MVSDDISKNATAKRLNMFLRWMVRKDNRGVDFGLWDRIAPAGLFIPLDIHTGTVARKLNLLKENGCFAGSGEKSYQVLNGVYHGEGSGSY